MTEPFDEKLERAKRDGLLRSLRVAESCNGRSAIIDGKEVILFGSNDYLGLANHPDIKNAAIDCVKKYGWGSGASPLISGRTALHEKFEEKIASFLEKPAALMFSSGYSANVGVLTALMGRDDEIFADRLCHASIIDGARFSGAKLKRFAHNDIDSLTNLLGKGEGRGKRLIVTDGLFSMDGDKAPLKALAELASVNGAMLMVDDAHGFGVFGPDGRGTVHEAGISEMVDIHVVTLGKALGGSGGVVLGSRKLIDGLVNFSRSYIYSTAPPSAAACAGSAALEIVSGSEGDRRRGALFSNVETILSGLRKHGAEIGDGKSQIIPVTMGSEEKALDYAKFLLEGGVFVPAIRPPTVPPNSSRLRISIISEHTCDDLFQFLDIFGRITLVE